MSKRDFPISNNPSPEDFRSRFEGMWSAIPVSSAEGIVSSWNDFPEELLEMTEFMQLYILQDEEIPHRFVAQYKRLDIEGEMDIRVMPGAFAEDQGVAAMFTFIEDDEMEMMAGSGFASVDGDDILAGVMMLHMGEDFPFRWERISEVVPDDIREMMLEGQWLNEDEEEEDSDVFEGHNFMDEFNDLLGGLFNLGDIEVIMEDDDDEDNDGEQEESAEDAKTAAIQKTLEEFLLYQDELLDALAKGGIRSVAPLVEATDEELLAMEGIGPGELQEIRRVMQAWGLISRSANDYETDDEMLQRVYRFHVSLDWSPDIWREIELLGSHTLHDFHTIIQEAFGWDDEHLYAFYMSGQYWDGASAIEHPFSEGEISASDVLLAGLGLLPKQEFVYLFDFGEELRHQITLMSVSESDDSEKALPTITASQGEAPEQYSFDESDYEDDYENYN